MEPELRARWAHDINVYLVLGQLCALLIKHNITLSFLSIWFCGTQSLLDAALTYILRQVASLIAGYGENLYPQVSVIYPTAKSK